MWTTAGREAVNQSVDAQNIAWLRNFYLQQLLAWPIYVHRIHFTFSNETLIELSDTKDHYNLRLSRRRHKPWSLITQAN